MHNTYVTRISGLEVFSKLCHRTLGLVAVNDGAISLLHCLSEFLIDRNIDRSPGRSSISSSRSKSDSSSFEDPLQDSSPKSLLVRLRFWVLFVFLNSSFLFRSLPTFDIEGVLTLSVGDKLSYILALPCAMHKSRCENGDDCSGTSLSFLWKDLCLVVTLFRDEFSPLCELLKPAAFPFVSGEPFLRLDHRRFLFWSFQRELNAIKSSSSES